MSLEGTAFFSLERPHPSIKFLFVEGYSPTEIRREPAETLDRPQADAHT